jgi:hypothetical protein
LHGYQCVAFTTQNHPKNVKRPTKSLGYGPRACRRTAFSVIMASLIKLFGGEGRISRNVQSVEENIS